MSRAVGAKAAENIAAAVADADADADAAVAGAVAVAAVVAAAGALWVSSCWTYPTYPYSPRSTDTLLSLTWVDCLYRGWMVVSSKPQLEEAVVVMAAERAGLATTNL